MILLNWLNAFRHRIRQRRRKQQLPGSRSGLGSTSSRSKRPSRLTPQQIELLEERVLLSAVTVTTAADVLDGDTSSIGNLLATPGADGFVSLREAVVAANNTPGADSISIPAGTYTLSLSGASEDAGATGDLDITDELAITGAGSGNSTINGGGLDRVFHILADNVSIADLTVTGGDQTEGGGLRIENTATLNRLVVSGNVTGGGIYMRNSAATLTIDNSTIANNASAIGGGLDLSEGTTTITNSTISNNTATNRGGGIRAGGEVNLINSTVSGNSSQGIGGGVDIFGTSSIINSTITGNIADSDNTDTADGGGVIFANFNQLTLQNSIVAGNFVDGTSTPNDLSGAFAQLTNPRNNLIGDSGSSAGITHGANFNIVGNSGTGTIDINTVLNTALVNNGGLTATHSLVPGSPAINGGNNTTASTAGLFADQRGFGPRNQQGFVDIGSFEDAANPLDFGDAPGPYPTTGAQNGPRHAATGVTLGATRDAEQDGLPSPIADSDDSVNTDDEDGITFGSIQVGQQNASVTVNVQGGSGLLDAWIDFNGDGSFGGTLEQIFSSVAVVSGNNVLTFDVPAENTIAGTTFSRFRLSTSGGLSPAGFAADGEVEDHVVTLSQIGGDATFVDSGQNLGSGGQGVAIGDIDGDGDLDVFVANNTYDNKLYLNDGSGNLTDSGQTAFALNGEFSQSGEFADLDGDGDLDLFVGQRGSSDPQKIFFNNNGTFTDSGQSIMIGETYSIKLADIDGDGDLDAVTGFSTRVLKNDGNGIFTETQNLAVLNPSNSLSLGDIDGDGDIDIVFPRSSAPNQIWLNNGTGSFSYSGSPLGSYSTSYGSDVGDIDGDGDLDLVFAVHNSGGYGANEVYINQGGAQAGAEGNFLPGASFGNSSTRSIRLADLDGDGDLDAFAANNGVNKVWLNNGSGLFSDSGQSLGSGITFSNEVRLGDFDGDGTADAFVANQNDVNRLYFNQLSFETEVTLDGSNNLVITDANGGTSDDDVTISTNGTVITISDTSNVISTSISGATGSGTNTVTIPLSQITGSDIIVNTLAGDDMLTIDFSSGAFNKAITFNGGANSSGDSLKLTGNTFGSMSVTYANANDGTISISGNSLITFTGLEGSQQTLDSTGLAVANVTLTYSSANDSIDIDNAEGPTDITSSGGVATRISQPSGTLSVLGGDGNDTYTVTELESGFAGSFLLNGETGTDSITINGAINLASGKSVEIRGDNVTINSGITVADAGTITLVSTGGITLNGANADITTAGGTILIDARDVPATTGNLVQNNAGSTINSGGGALTLRGVTVDLAGSVSSQAGATTIDAGRNVLLNSGASVASTIGNITIDANSGGLTTGNFEGITVDAASVTSTSGSITLTGTGGDTGSNNHGVRVLNGGSVTSTGSGSVNLIGETPGPGDGVYILGAGTLVTSATGNLQITGTATTNSGVTVSQSAIASSTGTGTVGVIGTGADNGVIVVGDGLVTSLNGDISITGTSSGGDGVEISFDGKVTSTGTASISVDGTSTAGIPGGYGVRVAITGTQISSAGNDLSITGTSNGDAGINIWLIR
tara:strand:- start:32 stop:4702 length:4671 start_codon:yes stop_codon:yes gene_type:complete